MNQARWARWRRWWWPLEYMAAVEGTVEQQATAFAHNRAHRYLALVAAGRWALAGGVAYVLGCMAEALGWPAGVQAVFFVPVAIACAAVFWACAVFLLLSSPAND